MKKISFLLLGGMMLALFVAAPVTLSATTAAEQKILDCAKMGGHWNSAANKCSFS